MSILILIYTSYLKAARSGYPEIIEVLVKHGVDINERNMWGEGQSVLSVALDNFYPDEEFVVWLKSMGAVEIKAGEEL